MKTTLNLTIIIPLLAASNLSAVTHYVSPESTNSAPPYTNWITAATNIQAAVAVAAPGDVVLVTNGVYPGTVSVTNPLALRSVNGPQFTAINGGHTNRCASLTDGASLTGFTLTNGTGGYLHAGGGAYCSSKNVFLTNCVIAGNSSVGYWNTILPGAPEYYSAYAGGVSDGTLYNCTLTGNSADFGGGANSSILYNCTLSGNRSVSTVIFYKARQYYSHGAGGGAVACTLYNSIVYNNSGNSSDYANGTLNYCCTTPLPTNGVGNITNEPFFLDRTGGNLRLQSNSPCINAGNNDYVTIAIDLDGRARIIGGTVDMGAYEFQGPGIGEFSGWLQQYGLPTDGSADYVDSDADGYNNWQEYLADTSPVDANDYLHITSFTRNGTYNTLSWTSKATRLYQVERRAVLDASSAWEIMITNAAPGWNNVGFDNTGPQYFYRITAVRP